jgi:cytochrome c biogenesis protein CcdA
MFNSYNPFTAPDAADVVSSRKSAFRNMLFVLGSGVVFVMALIGGYALATRVLQTALPLPVQHVGIPTIATGTPHSVEARLQELGSTVELYTAEDVTERVLELRTQDAAAPQLEESSDAVDERLRELGT